ncbi:hypothetical protein [Alistipes onderdonkii]|jgi:hypothetical protein|uniref:hypothetical protein n=1 Tax=Alistipes onderdonkii TaxID=328813 RepID=UPI0036F3E223
MQRGCGVFYGRAQGFNPARNSPFWGVLTRCRAERDPLRAFSALFLNGNSIELRSGMLLPNGIVATWGVIVGDFGPKMVRLSENILLL